MMPGESDPDQFGTANRKMAGSATQLLVRRVVVQVLSAISTAVLARKLGTSGFGEYAAGLAMFYLASSVSDFGFGSVLARALGAGNGRDGRLVRSMLWVQTTWSMVVGAGVVVFALLVGLGTIKIQVLLVLAPCLAIAGLSGIRQVFYANYRTATLGLVDVITNVVQAGALVLLAFAGAGPVILACVLTIMSIINCLVLAVVGMRIVDAQRGDRPTRMHMLHESLPLGLGSLLASAYFMLDLTIVSFLVSSHEVANYAAATKFLSFLVVIPGLTITAVTPGLSAHAKNPAQLARVVASVWHWLAVSAVPLCVGVALYSHLLVRLYYGKSYAEAAPLLEILAISGVVAVASNVFGAAMVVTHRQRWLMIQGGLALLFNVTMNLLLVPHFGVTASAWLTVATELLVMSGAAFALRHTFSGSPMLRASISPAIGLAAMVATWAVTRQWPIPSIALAGTAFVVALGLTGGWPVEFPAIWPKRFVLWRIGVRDA